MAADRKHRTLGHIHCFCNEVTHEKELNFPFGFPMKSQLLSLMNDIGIVLCSKQQKLKNIKVG